ncbi:hypothetical protein N665_2097s0002 [Sinapis alba]|nr:hypothetical protein N665_2097s0002 [Sinapis alba]
MQITSGESSKAKRILPTRSEVWKHYTRTKEDRDKCVCHYCHNTFLCLTISGTSNLKSHLKKCKSHLAWSAGQEDKQPNIDDEGKPKKAKLTEGQLRETTNQMVVLGQVPLSFVESVVCKLWVYSSFKKNCD